VIIEQHEHFVKQTERSRCSIYGANGKLDLIVPISHNRKRASMMNVEIANEHDWQRLHWKSLEAAYRSSPYYEFYEVEFRSFYETKYGNLFKLNTELHTKLLELLKIETTITFTENYIKNPISNFDCRSLFLKNSKIKNMQPELTYFQVFDQMHGFIPNLSIIDLLFNKGPRAIDYLSVMAQTLRVFCA
jgi:hypothetical protein